jgi:hypothetical protein
MPRDIKTADSGDADVRLTEPKGSKRDVEELALELGYADTMGPHPVKEYAARGMTVVVKDAGASNRALYAAARAYNRWPIGMQMTEAEFRKAIDQVANLQFGDHPPPVWG